MEEWQLNNPNAISKPMWKVYISKDGVVCDCIGSCRNVYFPFSSAFQIKLCNHSTGNLELAIQLGNDKRENAMSGIQHSDYVRKLYTSIKERREAYFARDREPEMEALLTRAVKAGFDMAMEQLRLAPIAGEEFRQLQERNDGVNGMGK
jgi:hypothetical protein